MKGKPMNRPEPLIVDVAREIVASALSRVAPEADASMLDPDRDLREQLDIDSMDYVNLVIDISQQTGLDVPERDYPKLASLDGFAAYLVELSGRTARSTHSDA